MSRGPTITPDDDPLGPVVESFLDRFRRGERPALSDLVARYPDLAGPIRELIPALVELEQLGVEGTSGVRAGASPTADGPAPRRLGDYLILRRIGGGGMGVVYEAEHESLRSRVALKVMHPRYRADARYLHRFHAEARLAAGLHHTNIVSVFDYGAEDGVCYYAMQFILGQPLDLVLADIHRLREPVDRPAAPDGGEPAVSVMARGLFTGRYRAASGDPCATIDLEVDGDPRPGTTITGPVVPATVVAALVDDADATAPLPSGSGSDPTAGSSGDGPPASSASLGESGEMRYFREIARVGAQVADALEYAHRRGVLHRDIKPSNLLLDALGNVWITDFGLAKLEEGEGFTQSHELVGTLRYMAPERLRGTSGRRGDTYSLGATLYELLTLRPPFTEGDQLRLIAQIRDAAPTAPRQIDRHIPRDVETIVLKAMAKDPKDRFASAGEMAAELRRFVEGRPIRSRPVSIPERFWRWCKRDPKLAAASVFAALLAVGGTAAALLLRDQVVRIRSAETATRRALADSLRDQARGTRLSRRAGQRFESLATLRQAAAIARELDLPPSDLDRIRDEAIACLALPDLEPVGPRVVRPTGAAAMTFDRTMTRSAIQFRDGTVSVRRLADGREIARFRVLGDREHFVLAFSPDGRYLLADDVPGHAVHIWDVDRDAAVAADPGLSHWAVFRPDSRRVLSGDAAVREYDLATGRLVRAWPERLVHAAYRPDGARLAGIDAATSPPTCRIFEADSARPVGAFRLRVDAASIAWSPDGRTLAIVCVDSKIDLWDAATGIRRASMEGFDNGGVWLSFHPDGTLMASNGWEGRLRLWDPVRGQPILSVNGSSTAFDPEGRMVLWYGDTGRVHRAESAREYRTFAHATDRPMDYATPSIHPGGRLLAVGSDRGVVLWDLAGGAELAHLPIGLAWSSHFEPTGDLITGGMLGIRRWPVRIDAGRGVVRIGPPRRLPLPPTANEISQDATGEVVGTADYQFAYVTAPGRKTLRVGPLEDCRYLAISPDGRWLATGTHVTSRGAQVWRVADGVKVADLPIDGGTNTAFTPDGCWLITTFPKIRAWEVGTWRERSPAPGVGHVFSADGRLSAAVEPSRIVRLIEYPSGRALARLESPDLCGIATFALAPDGSRLVVTSKDRPMPCVHVWDLRAIRKRLAAMGLDWDAPAYPEPDPALSGPPGRLSVEVDMGPLAGLCDDAWDELRRAKTLEDQGRVGDAVAALRAATARFPGFAELHNAIAWIIATEPGTGAAMDEAVEHARRAVELDPDDPMPINTLGVALYRDGKYAEAVPVLERSLEAGQGFSDAYDLLFLAMAHQRLGDRGRARDAYDRAVRWIRDRRVFRKDVARELRAFRREALSVLAEALPDDVFAPAR